MPVSVEALLKCKEAAEHLAGGHINAARTAVAEAKAIFDLQAPAMTEDEELLAYAGLALMMRRSGMPTAAAGILERVCNLAIRLEPDDPRTIGDLTDLATVYSELGRHADALATWRRARPVCVRATPGYLPNLEAEISAVKARLTPLTRGQVEIRVSCPAVNYSLAHARTSVLTALQIDNTGTSRARISLRVALPGFATSTGPFAVELEPKQGRDLRSDVRLNLVPDRLLAQAERASAGVEVYADGHLAASCETWILPYGECSLERGHEPALAGFVQPNNPAVRTVARRCGERLREIGSWRMIRESTRPDRIDLVARAVHDSLAEYKLVYDYEPPCWEINSQRVRFADEVIVDRTGTCLDLMLLAASALENMLVAIPAQPVLILTSTQAQGQHALIGCWRNTQCSAETVITDRDRMVTWADSGDLFVMDSTGFALGNPFNKNVVGFDTAVRTGQELLRQTFHLVAINLAAVRPDPRTGRPGITPLPARCEPAYDERALAALWQARAAWANAPTRGIQSAHLFIGLLTLDDGMARLLFDELARLTGNQRLTAARVLAHLTAGLSQVSDASIGTPEETEGFAVAKKAAIHEAIRMGAAMVGDSHLLFATLRRPGDSITKALRHLGTSPAECLTQLERMVPTPDEAVRSEFPSEVHDYQ